MYKFLGYSGTDRVTGFKGVIVGTCEYLYGCRQLGLTPKVKDNKRGGVEWFDEGRIKIGKMSIEPQSVQVSLPGPESHGPESAPSR